MAKRTKKVSICEEILIQILNLLPIKSLMRFKCVSKYWLQLIEDPYFANCYRAHSHTRPGSGIQLLSMLDFKSKLCLLSDPEGNFKTGLENKTSGCRYLRGDQISSVEGLVCYGLRVWNPSTRETMNLPIPPVRFLKYRRRNVHFLLGFDAFADKYKVVCCCEAYESLSHANQVPAVYALTLGENSWKEIPFIPKKLRCGFEVFSSRSFSNMIFCLITFDIDHKFGVLTLDVQREQVGLISFPYKLSKSNWNDDNIHLAEIDGQLAFTVSFSRTLWVLNHENARWTKMEINTAVGCSHYFNSYYDVVSDGHRDIEAHLIPIGTIHTDEILCQYMEVGSSLGVKKLLEYLYYNPNTKKIRFVPKLDKIVDDLWRYPMIKIVESIVRLKPLKQN